MIDTVTHPFVRYIITGSYCHPPVCIHKRYWAILSSTRLSRHIITVMFILSVSPVRWSTHRSRWFLLFLTRLSIDLYLWYHTVTHPYARHLYMYVMIWFILSTLTLQ